MITRPRLYGRMTWPEVAEAVRADPVCLIPVATLEDHGHHLPIDADLRIVEEICRRAAEEAPEEILLLPEGRHAWFDWSDGPLKLMPWWSSFSRTGVQGRPTLATAEKGKVLLEAAVDECVAYVRELREKPLPERSKPVGPS